MTELNSAEQDRVLGRIRKLMALANDSAATEGERDNAIRMAHATLAKHGLSMAEAEAAGQKEEKRGEEVGEARDQPWARQVAYAIAQLFFCRFYYDKAGAKARGKCGLVFIGRLSNAVTAKELALYVIGSIQKEANREWKKQVNPGPWWTSFCKGAADHISVRCEKLRAEAEAASKAASSGTSLVLASYYKTELLANEAWLKAHGPKLRTTATRTKEAGYGYGAGHAFGGGISLNRQVGGSSGGVLRIGK